MRPRLIAEKRDKWMPKQCYSVSKIVELILRCNLLMLETKCVFWIMYFVQNKSLKIRKSPFLVHMSLKSYYKCFKSNWKTEISNWIQIFLKWKSSKKISSNYFQETVFCAKIQRCLSEIIFYLITQQESHYYNWNSVRKFFMLQKLEIIHFQLKKKP